MKRLYFLSFLLVVCVVNTYAYEERNLLQKKIAEIPLQSVLLTNRQWVQFPAYENRQGWDDFTAENKQNLINDGEKYLEYEWKVVRATDYLAFTRTGDRTVMESRYGANNKALAALFMAEMAEGKGRFIDQLINGVYHMCEMTSWSLSAHVGVQKAKGSLPDHKQNIIDLLVGDMGATLSWMHYFLNKEFDKVSPLISKRLYDEIEARVFEPYLDESTPFWWMGLNVTEKSGMVNNWNIWCNANVLQSFLLIDKNKERMRKAVERTILSADKFINYVKTDGACEEGPAYWGHAAGKLCDYLELLSNATGGKISIFDEPMIRNMGEYISRSYVGDDWVVNFADAGAKMRPDSRLVYRYGKLVNSDEMMQFAAYLNKGSKISASRDTYRTLYDLAIVKELTSLSGTHKLPTYTWYPETEFCYMTTDNVFFAAKGGHNDESHNHNDIGTFSLYVDNVPVFIDAGVGTYMRQTFSSERYTLWYMQSNYHNLPVINGVAQKNGRKYKAKDARFDSKKRVFSLDISGAYPSDAIQKWIRSYKLGSNSLDIEDSFGITSPDQPNVIHFMTWGDADASVKGIVTITVNGKTVSLKYDPKKFEASVENVEIDDKRLTNVWGERVQRISLKALSTERSGSYKYKITF
ncbi:MAG: heparinase II/III-family protein [Prevotella sp.]|jgi:hypothetical protein|nr:heparinase II/III-family protein [Prevotella sp.]